MHAACTRHAQPKRQGNNAVRLRSPTLRLFDALHGDEVVKHFHEHLRERHGYRLGYTVTRLALQRGGAREAGAPA